MSDRGKPIIVVQYHKFHQTFLKKNGEIRWKCSTVKSCCARLFTDESCTVILSEESDHIHENNTQKLERKILRTACKQKATDLLSEPPFIII